MLIGINDKLCESASSKRLDYLTGLEIIHRETKGGLERALGFVHVSLASPWLLCRASGDIVNHSNLSVWRTASSSAVSCLRFWRCGWRHLYTGHMVRSSELCVKNPAPSFTMGLAFSTKAWLCLTWPVQNRLRKCLPLSTKPWSLKYYYFMVNGLQLYNAI